MWATFNCTEFTNLCPVTNQPDFAKIYISYIPDKFLLESKSLKIYLFSFRNHPSFHETTINVIANDIFKKISPNFLEVVGEFFVRGGISIHPYVSLSNKRFTDFKNKRFQNYRFEINPIR